MPVAPPLPTGQERVAIFTKKPSWITLLPKTPVKLLKRLPEIVFVSSREHMMTRIRIAPLLFSLTAFALAANGVPADGDRDWRIYSKEANGDVYFFDASRVKSTSDLRTVWQRIRYKRSVMAASSYQSLIEIDCPERTQRILQRTFFSDKHWKTPAMSTDMKAKPKRSIVEGSASARLSEVVCVP